MYEMPMRFYGQTEAAVKECASQLMQINPLILGTRFSTAKRDMISQNWHTAPSHVLMLQVKDYETSLRVHEDGRVAACYMRYAKKGGGATLVKVKPGMTAFKL